MKRPAYIINQSIHVGHKRRYHRRLWLLAAALLIIGIVTGVIVHDLYRIKHNGSKKPVGAAYEQNIGGQQVFRSSYFQFSDSSKWVFAPNDSTATKLTYLLYVSGLPAHSLTVYVNQIPTQDDLAVTRLLPVRIKDGNMLEIGSISEPCSSQYKSTDLKRIRMLSLNGTSMLCVPDSPQFSVEAALIGGDYTIPLKRSGDVIAHYIIIYRNLTIDPDPTPFTRIMPSFKAL